MRFELPKLPYSYDALEPYIDSETLEIHYSKHHATYVEKLNTALKGIDNIEDKSIEDILKDINIIPENVRQAVINNGGGHANHSLYWETMSPKSAKIPSGELADEINNVFGSFDSFKEKFTEKSLSLFGSGWVFLIVTKDKKISIKRHSFQNSPFLQGNTPLLGLDLWEHAYYLKYRNKRADYISAWWNIVNWKEVSRRYEQNFK